MRKTATLIAASIAIGAVAIAAPDAANARSVSGTIAEPTASSPVTQPARDFSSQRRYRTYTPRAYTSRYTPPRSNNAPRYIYPGSRDALDTCAFC